MADLSPEQRAALVHEIAGENELAIGSSERESVTDTEGDQERPLPNKEQVIRQYLSYQDAPVAEDTKKSYLNDSAKDTMGFGATLQEVLKVYDAATLENMASQITKDSNRAIEDLRISVSPKDKSISNAMMDLAKEYYVKAVSGQGQERLLEPENQKEIVRKIAGEYIGKKVWRWLRNLESYLGGMEDGQEKNRLQSFVDELKANNGRPPEHFDFNALGTAIYDAITQIDVGDGSENLDTKTHPTEEIVLDTASQTARVTDSLDLNSVADVSTDDSSRGDESHIDGEGVDNDSGQGDNLPPPPPDNFHGQPLEPEEPDELGPEIIPLSVGGSEHVEAGLPDHEVNPITQTEAAPVAAHPASREDYHRAQRDLEQAEARYTETKKALDDLESVRGFFDKLTVGAFSGDKDGKAKARIDFKTAEEALRRAHHDYSFQRGIFLGPELRQMLTERMDTVDEQAEGRLKTFERAWKRLGDLNAESLAKSMGFFRDSDEAQTWYGRMGRGALKAVNVRTATIAALGFGVGGALGGAMTYGMMKGVRSLTVGSIAAERAAAAFEGRIKTELGVEPWRDTVLPPEARQKITQPIEVGEEDDRRLETPEEHRLRIEEYLSQMEAGMARRGIRGHSGDAPLYRELLGTYAEMQKDQVEQHQEARGRAQEIQALLDGMRERSNVRLDELNKEHRKAFLKGAASALVFGSVTTFGFGWSADRIHELLTPQELMNSVHSLGHTLQEYEAYEHKFQPRLDELRHKILSGQPFTAEDYANVRNMESWHGTPLGDQAHKLTEYIDHKHLLESGQTNAEFWKVDGSADEVSLREFLSTHAKDQQEYDSLLQAANDKFGPDAGNYTIHKGDGIFFDTNTDGTHNLFFAGDSGHQLNYHIGAPNEAYKFIYEPVMRGDWGSSNGFYETLKQRGSEEFFKKYYQEKVGYLSSDMSKQIDGYIKALREAWGKDDISNEGVAYFKAFLTKHGQELRMEDWAKAR